MSALATLQKIVDDGVVDEVIQQLKTGKEAEVYLVRKGEHLLAAKLYKARAERNFKNNAGYLEGRNVRSSRDARAMAKGSRYGRAQQEEAWKHAEVDALYKLHAAGVRVPAPDIFYEGVLVMELVVDAEGYPAPRLADLQLDAEQATALYLDLLRQVGIMLSCDLIHGDLSPFNVLLAHNGPTIIDLPQVVTAPGNPQAEMFFRRDVRNLHQFFAQFAPNLSRHPDGGADLWNRYKRSELFPGYVPDLGTLTDDSPVPTFKAKQDRPPRGRGRGRGPGPEVQYKGQLPVQPAAQPAPQPAQQHRPHGPSPRPQQGQPRPQGQHGQPRPQGQHGQPRPHGQHGRPQQQGQHGQPRPQGQPRPHGQGAQQHGQQRPQGQHGQPRPQGQHGQPRPQGQPQQHGQQRPQGQPRPHGQGTQPHGQQRPQGQPRPHGQGAQPHGQPRPQGQGQPAPRPAGGGRHHHRRHRPGPPRQP